MKTPEGAEFIPTEKRTSKIKVLFVDDEIPIIESYTRYFEKQGFEARGIGTAAEAVEIYSDWQPNVVVVDVHLAEESGLALLGRLSRLGAKVIVLTNDDSPENLITAMNRNAREFLVKPVDMARLQKAIQLCA